jgi:hypothetical protein
MTEHDRLLMAEASRLAAITIQQVDLVLAEVAALDLAREEAPEQAAFAKHQRQVFWIDLASGSVESYPENVIPYPGPIGGSRP